MRDVGKREMDDMWHLPPLTDQPQVTTLLEPLLADRQTNNTRSVLWLEQR
jgi:hypothetical protein